MLRFQVNFQYMVFMHSLRASGATKAANSNVSDRCWKRHGRCRGQATRPKTDMSLIH